MPRSPLADYTTAELEAELHRRRTECHPREPSGRCDRCGATWTFREMFKPHVFARQADEFAAARRDLGQSGLKSMVIWALSDNEPATEFYRALGGRMVARSSERFGPKSLDKVAFAWNG